MLNSSRLKENSFIVNLLLVALVLFLFSWWWHDEELKSYFPMAIVGISAFTFHNIVFYFYAKYLSEKSADRKFLGMIYLNFLVKLIIAVSIPVIFYYKMNKPNDFHIVAFIIIYISYTIFETYTLNRMAVMR